MDIRLFQKINLRLRYLISFLMIFIVVTLFSVILYSFYQDNNIRYVNTSTLEKFTYAADNISNMVQHLDTVAATTPLENTLTCDQGKISIQTDTQVFVALEKLESRLTEGIHAFFFIRGDKYIYTSKDKMYYNKFESEMSVLYDLSMSMFYYKMNSITDYGLIKILTRNGKSNALARIIPYPISEKNTCGLLIFLIPGDIVYRELENYLGQITGDTYIADRRSNILYQYLPEGNSHVPFRQLILRRGVGLQSIDAEHILLSVNHAESGLIYLLCTNKDVFYGSIQEQLQRFRVYIICLLILLAILSVWMLMFNYKPINHLVADITGKSNRHLYGNEISLIRDYYQRTVDKVDSLNTRLSTLTPMVAQQFLYKWVHGQIPDRSSFEVLARYAGLVFPHPYFTVIYVLPFVDYSENDLIYEQIPAMIDRAVFPQKMILTGNLRDENAFFMIVNFNRLSGNEEELRAISKHLCALLEKNRICKCRFGVGSISEDPLSMNVSLAEARTVVQLSSNVNEEVCFYHSSMRKVNSSDELPEMSPLLVSILTGAIHRGENSLAHQALHDILDQISFGTSSFLLYRFYSGNIVNLLLHLAKTKEIPIDQARLQPLLNIKSKQEFDGKIVVFLDELCDAVRQRQINSDIQERDQLLAYIMEHFTDADLSIQIVADATGIRKSRISDIVKADFGLNFGQYISYLRLNEFKRLLVETDRTIADLVNEIGYIDVSNFLRKFKITEGMTAGQYRKQYMDESID